MLRKIKVSTRLKVLIVLMLLSVLIVTLIVNYSFGKMATNSFQRLEKTLLDGHQDKLKSATRSMALTLGELIDQSKSVEENEEILRIAIDKTRFESDLSGYFLFIVQLFVWLFQHLRRGLGKIWLMSQTQTV